MLPLLRFMDFCTWWFRRFLGYLLKINSVLCISVLFNSAIVCAVGGGEGAERERGGGGKEGRSIRTFTFFLRHAPGDGNSMYQLFIA